MASTPPAAAPSVTEYNIRVPKNQKKKYQVMRYNSSLKIDFQKWSQVKMERENNMREFKGPEEEQPKFGAGSEFGRDAREEARRKKFGIVSKRYKSEAQPWLIKVKQAGKSFGYRGVREGGIAENAAYYVFTHAPDGGIDAYPLQEWYNFQPIQRYKALSAEEAEEEFGRRNKLLNYFSVMTRKRCRGKDDEAELDDPDDVKMKKGGTKKKELKISDMDDWMDSSEDEESGSDKEEKNQEEKKEEKEKKKKQKEKAKNIKKKKKKRDSEDEAFEESDDGDEEGREMDYISDSSDSESDNEGKANKELKGVSEEKALRNLLSSGSEDEEDKVENNKDKEESDKEEEKEGEKGKEGAKEEGKDKTSKKKKKKKKKVDKKAVKKEETKLGKASSSEFSSDSDTDSEMEAKRKAKREKGGKEGKEGKESRDGKEPKEAKESKESKEGKEAKESTSGNSSRSATPTRDGKEASESNKRKNTSTPEPGMSKKQRLDNFASAPFTASPVISNEAGITEDAVRRYLMRKPMTTTELLQKFKSKKTGLSSDQLVNIMTQILKRINPIKQTIKGKMYLSIKR